jgi:hypothetical protein
LTNPRNIPARKFALLNSSQAIYCLGSLGPVFEGGTDIHVTNNCRANNGSQTYIAYGYVNDTGIDSAQVFTGEQHFTAKEVEVLTICGQTTAFGITLFEGLRAILRMFQHENIHLNITKLQIHAPVGIGNPRTRARLVALLVR